ncbi:MAG: HAMP domain-containing histidine kinase [Actinomycetota bacterium]|nr:HAMP domain-containing histidine kinase [Actinomycetota bacterium]
MSFRARLALVAAAAVGLAVVAASAVIFVLVRDQLRTQADEALQTRAEEISHSPLREGVGPGGKPYLDVRGPPFASIPYTQVVRADGTVLRPFNERAALPVTRKVLDAARNGSDPFFSDAEIGGRDVRVRTLAGPGYALQVARDMSEVNSTLHRVGIFLFLIAAGGIAVAAGMGLAVSKAALRPVRRLTETAEHVTDTGDLSERIDVTGQDELSRLATSFNTMLAALEESSRAQRQLVADASHELRTPLTSLRTNIEVLARGNKLAKEERERLLADVVEQIGEMTSLIGELIELARGEREEEQPEDVRLDLIAADAVERARRNRPNVAFTTDFEESLVHGAASTIERAVANLLDNAAKWSPPGGEVEVGVRAGEVSVRDHGPGIDDEDLPYVFDRFYRARSARGQPGSGLGLAIVKQVAEAHGGQVVAERPEGGGTLMRLRLNGRNSS